MAWRNIFFKTSCARTCARTHTHTKQGYFSVLTQGKPSPSINIVFISIHIIHFLKDNNLGGKSQLRLLNSVCLFSESPDFSLSS